jgi:hypothetical protein
MTDSTAFRAKHAEDVRQIQDVSEGAFQLFHRLKPQAPGAEPARFRDIIFGSVEVAESTTRAITTLLKQDQHLPVMALVRVRLEQLIVTSYLVHERPDVGLKPYAAFTPIREYRTAQAVLAEPFLAPHVQGRVQVDDLKAKAFAAQLDINPGFDIKEGKLQAKWTPLDLYSMAVKRDTLVDKDTFIISAGFALAGLYTSFYKTASCVVHADASALATPFRGTMKSDDGTIEIDAATYWSLALPVFVTTYDLVQCYEALRWSGLNCDPEFSSLVAKLG